MLRVWILMHMLHPKFFLASQSDFLQSNNFCVNIHDSTSKFSTAEVQYMKILDPMASRKSTFYYFYWSQQWINRL